MARTSRPTLFSPTRAAGVAIIAFASHLPASVGAAAAGTPESMWSWATIGAPGNAPINVGSAPWLPPSRAVGGVDYEYRMAKTEVTNGQWLAFVRAYAPYVSNDEQANSAFTGAVVFNGRDANNIPVYSLDERLINTPAGVTWRYAARYCNWLNNDMRLTRDAFANGAYDTSTFTFQPNSWVFNDQRTRSPGARFWIPSESEWVKAAYFDPNRFGPGKPGYWRYPNGQDTPLVGGFPGQPGAQSSGPLEYTGGTAFDIPVGSYPTVNHPWGLLDVSGGAAEWTEGIDPEVPLRIVRGSGTGSGFFAAWWDDINFSQAAGPNGHGPGFRIATVVPAPASALVFLTISSWGVGRRKR